MFAPFCPVCGHRVLLGTDQIVRFAWDGDGQRVAILRCYCGELVDWNQQPPAPSAPIRPEVLCRSGPATAS